jgi:hypothetical protein
MVSWLCIERTAISFVGCPFAFYNREMRYKFAYVSAINPPRPSDVRSGGGLGKTKTGCSQRYEGLGYVRRYFNHEHVLSRTGLRRAIALSSAMYKKTRDSTWSTPWFKIPCYHMIGQTKWELLLPASQSEFPQGLGIAIQLEVA